MMLVTEFARTATDFPPGRAVERWPPLTFELGRVVPNGDTVMSYSLPTGPNNGGPPRR